jgi:hypothetical protein
MMHTPASTPLPKAETPTTAQAPVQPMTKPAVTATMQAPAAEPQPSPAPPREATVAPTPSDRGQTLDLPLSRPPQAEAQPFEAAPKPLPASSDKDEEGSKPE